MGRVKLMFGYSIDIFYFFPYFSFLLFLWNLFIQWDNCDVSINIC